MYVKRNSAPTDFALLQLNQTPSPTSGIFYSGWSRSNVTPIGSVCLHHPRGDVMKFSKDVNTSGISSWNGTFNHWSNIFDQGIVQGGSSGAPLYDLNHRIVGQLHGDQSNTCPGTDNTCFCNHTHIGEFGRFDLSWTGGGTNATRLSNWLDPNNSGAVTTNTANIANLTPANPTLSISGASLFCTGSSTYILNGAPAGKAITWSTSDPNVGSIPAPSYGATVSVTRVNAGNIVLTATVQGCPVNSTATKSIHIGGYSSPDYPISGPGSVYCGNPAYFSTNQLSGATSYTWYYPSGWSASGSSTYSLALQVPSRTTGNSQVSVRVGNACDAGGSAASTQYFYVSCGFAPQYTVSPNPASNEVTVTGSKTTAKSTSATSITEVNIYDQLGILKKNQKFSKVPKATVNLSGLSTGVYVIEIVDGTNKVRQKLSILK